MDPVTIFFIATLMMLANGGVLGLMHKDLRLPMRPAAACWRIATLLFAGGSILFAAQGLNPPAYTLALANALVMFGFTGYLRALRQFYGLKDQLWVMVPAALGTVAGLFMGIVGVLFMPLVGAAIGEWLAQRDHGRALKVGVATWLGIMAGLVSKVVIAFMMVGIFVVALIV